MNKQIIENIKKEIKEMPEYKSGAINSIDWMDASQEIGKKFLLNLDETEILQTETGLVLVGASDLEQYITNVEDIGISKNETMNLVKEIFDKIFEPIAKITEENLKKSLNNMNIKWDQRMRFVLSGGDYSFFMKN